MSGQPKRAESTPPIFLSEDFRHGFAFAVCGDIEGAAFDFEFRLGADAHGGHDRGVEIHDAYWIFGGDERATTAHNRRLLLGTARQCYSFTIMEISVFFRIVVLLLLPSTALIAENGDVYSSHLFNRAMTMLSQKAFPTFAQVRQSINDLETLASSSSSADALAVKEIKEAIKSLYSAAYQFQQVAAQEEKARAELEAARQKEQNDLKRPPQRIGGAIDMDLLHNHYLPAARKMQEDAKRGISAAAKKKIEMRERLTDIAKTVDQKIRAELVAEHSAVVVALGSCLHGVLAATRTAPDFDPAVSSIWVAMKKMSQDEVNSVQMQATEDIVKWIGARWVAGMVTEAGFDGVITASNDRDGFGMFLAGMVAWGGFEAKRRTEERINECLEMLFFEFSATASKEVNQALNAITAQRLQPNELGTEVLQGLVMAKLKDVNPVLAQRAEAVHIICGLLVRGVDIADRLSQ